MEAHVFAKISAVRWRARQLVGDELPPDVEAADDLGAPGVGRLPALGALFGLGDLALEVVACLLAIEYDPGLRALIRANQSEVGPPCLELGTIAELLSLPIERVPELVYELSPSAPLREWALVESEGSDAADVPAVYQRVKLAARVARYLVDENRLLDGMVLHPPSVPVDELPAEREAHVGRALRAAKHGPLVVQIVGRPNTGRRATARAFAHRLGRPLVEVDLRGVDKSALPRRLAEVRREARLSRAVPALVSWDAVLPKPAARGDEHAPPPAESVARSLPAPLARFFEEIEGPVVLVAEEAEPLVGFHAPAVVTIDVPFSTPAERARMFRQALERRSARPAPGVDLDSITRRFALDQPHIEVAARTAVDEVRAHDASAVEVSHAAIITACRQQVKHDLKSLAERVEKSHAWEDLVIPVDVYHSLVEMVAFVKHAKQVYDDWGFAQQHSLSRGVSALFAGPPGTGKTMCASVMARSLDMELFRVDLSRVVSKWIGETEKNLAKIFDEAQHSNAIILFDEADSLFAKRTEVRSSVDRYANLEVNFLLQRMEAFGGVTILTTNFEDTIDTAFKRRLTFRMRFEKPDADARTALWEKVFPTKCELGEDVDPRRLAELFEMSGGNIRNAALRAGFLAAAAGTPITMEHCLQAAERESREMGLLTRGLPAKDHLEKAEPVESPPSKPPRPLPPGAVQIRPRNPAPRTAPPPPTNGTSSETPSWRGQKMEVTHWRDPWSKGKGEGEEN